MSTLEAVTPFDKRYLADLIERIGNACRVAKSITVRFEEVADIENVVTLKTVVEIDGYFPMSAGSTA